MRLRRSLLNKQIRVQIHLEFNFHRYLNQIRLANTVFISEFALFLSRDLTVSSLIVILCGGCDRSA